VVMCGDWRSSGRSEVQIWRIVGACVFLEGGLLSVWGSMWSRPGAV